MKHPPLKVITISAASVMCMVLLLTRTPAFQRWRYTYLWYASEVSPINFYGKVVDQSGGPLGGAEVVLIVSTANFGYVFDASEEMLREERIVRTTGTDGSFQLKGLKGRHLRVVKISKPGYETIPSPRQNYAGINPWLYDYMRSSRPPYKYKPNASKPAIYPLSRIGEVNTSQPSRGG